MDWPFLIFPVSMVLIVLGFNYIVYVLATKETGILKTGGQILSIFLAISIVVSIIYILSAGSAIWGRIPGSWPHMMTGSYDYRARDMLGPPGVIETLVKELKEHPALWEGLKQRMR